MADMVRVIFFLGCLILSSCSPFGNQSLVEDISSSIAGLFKGESSKVIVAGATQVVETNPGSPAQNYKVSVSVGGVFSQPAIQTTDGYTVQTSIQ